MTQEEQLKIIIDLLCVLVKDDELIEKIKTGQKAKIQLLKEK